MGVCGAGGNNYPYPWGITASHAYANYGLIPVIPDWRWAMINGSNITCWLISAKTLSVSTTCKVMSYSMWRIVFSSSYSKLPADGSAISGSIEIKMTGRFFHLMNGTSSCSKPYGARRRLGRPPKDDPLRFPELGSGSGRYAAGLPKWRRKVSVSQKHF